MTVAILVGAVAVVAALAIRLNWRGSGDERQSVRHYHETVETLRHLSERNPATARRSQPPVQTNTSRAESTAQRSSTARAVSELASARHRHLAGRARTGRRAAAGSRQPDSPRLAPTVLSVAMVVVLIALLAIGLTDRHSPGTHNAGSPTRHSTGVDTARSATSASRGRSSTSLGASRSATKPSGSRPSSRGRAKRTTSPPTVEPTTSSALEADYTAPMSSYVVDLSASGPCWVLASEPQTGTVVWQGTLEAGQTRQIPAAGDLFLRLGAAYAVTLFLNGETVVLPAGHSSPFDVAFQTA